MLIFFFVCQLCQENVSYLEYHKTCGFSRQLCKFTQAFAGEIFFFWALYTYVCNMFSKVWNYLMIDMIVNVFRLWYGESSQFLT